MNGFSIASVADALATAGYALKERTWQRGGYCKGGDDGIEPDASEPMLHMPWEPQWRFTKTERDGSTLVATVELSDDGGNQYPVVSLEILPPLPLHERHGFRGPFIRIAVNEAMSVDLDKLDDFEGLLRIVRDATKRHLQSWRLEPPPDEKVRSVKEQAAKLDRCEEAVARSHPGEVVAFCYGLVLAHGDTEEEVVKGLKDADRTLPFVLRRMPGTPKDKKGRA